MIYNGRSQPQKLPDNIVPSMVSSFPYKRHSLVVVLLDIMDIPVWIVFSTPPSP